MDPADRAVVVSSLGRLSASPDSDPAAWIPATVRGFAEGVGSIVPPVFDAYARVFHPARFGFNDEGRAVRWADVASANGTTMHPAAEWGSLVGSWQRQSDPGLWNSAPSKALPEDVALGLAAILAGHSSEQDHCYFGVWEGWGRPSLFGIRPRAEDLSAAAEAIRRARKAFYEEVEAWHGFVESGATFAIPGRTMHLLFGPLEAIEDFYERKAGSRFTRTTPSAWWPEDRAWFVGGDVDLNTTYVGGSSAAIKAVLTDERLEALPVPDTQGVAWDTDTINPLPSSRY